ncbi:ATP-binding protein [Oceaniradius stylonematis]|uniref:ATP-binding protein n=1 Tax=Oceaniradius stylonematis TaxID=2184161 RepID=UPI0035D0B6AE
MRRLAAISLRTQLVILILGALVVAQIVSLFLFVDERSLAVRAALGMEAAGRAANVVRLIEEAPPSLHASILRAANSPLVRFDVGPMPNVQVHDHNTSGPVVERIRGLLGAAGDREIRLDLREIEAGFPAIAGVPDGMARMHSRMMHGRMSAIEMNLSIALGSGEWLNVGTRFQRPPLQWTWLTALSFGLTAALILAAALWFMLSRLTGPLSRLAGAADRLGRGEHVAELAPAGPSEVQELTEAFNQMQARLTRFVSDRTRLLGALGHDLRSPLTAMRVRAEMVEDQETRERLIATIGEMQQMVDETLAFARGMANAEAYETHELSAFLRDLCSDLAETGQDVELSAEPDLWARLRPTALRRALRNIIDNAVRYGGSARVSLAPSGDNAEITVADDGPGIPQEDVERVFDPFVRIETSRSRETGGAGLGLAIARTIIQGHGGNIELANRPEGGLTAAISLPLVSDPAPTEA